jgi:dihydrofolate reductase
MKAPIILVLAMADNGVIGVSGAIPWRIADDMQRFKALTMGKPIVMGRKTWDSFPKKPLPGRTNIVVTRDRSWRAEGATVAHSFEDALLLAEREQPSEIAVIGGAEIYKAAIPLAARVELTQVHIEPQGDTRLAPFDTKVWRESARSEHTTPDGLRYSYVTLMRR